MSVTDVKVGGLMFVKVKSVTRPILKIEKGGKPVYFRCDGPIVQAEQMEKGREKLDANGVALPPPFIMPVTNLETGEENTIVLNKVLHSELEKNYPDQSYVSRCFAVEKYAPSGDKRYSTFMIAEVELKQETAATSASPSKTAKK